MIKKRQAIQINTKEILLEKKSDKQSNLTIHKNKFRKRKIFSE